MSKALALAVAAGLAVGIAFVALFATLMNDFPLLRVQSTSRSGEVSAVVIPEGTSLLDSGKTFDPQVIRVVIGLNNTVRWTNQDIAANWIEANSYDDPDFANATLTPRLIHPGESFEYTFNKVGEFGYHGKPHQLGTVIVLPPIFPSER